MGREIQIIFQCPQCKNEANKNCRAQNFAKKRLIYLPSKKSFVFFFVENTCTFFVERLTQLAGKKYNCVALVFTCESTFFDSF